MAISPQLTKIRPEGRAPQLEKPRKAPALNFSQEQLDWLLSVTAPGKVSYQSPLCDHIRFTVLSKVQEDIKNAYNKRS